jgi:glucosamine 6-phosphate synthetase-like amidotransferase/phosphosugar isomerase protein
MCGIIGYVGSIQFSLDSCLDILKALEVEQLPIEPSPIGGHGAGLMVYDGIRVLMEKVGGIGASPADDLRRIIYDSWKINFSRVILGHVRRASQVFTHTIPFKECTQPYIAECLGEFKVVSVHNGFLKNYLDLKGRLKHKHKFESENIALIDSEVFPHLLEELILDYGDGVETAKMLFDSIEGGNTVAMMVFIDGAISLYVIHKGVTRGLALWRNSLGHVLFASRSYIVDKLAKGFLKENGFNLDFIIKPRSEGSFVRYYRFSIDELFKS